MRASPRCSKFAGALLLSTLLSPTAFAQDAVVQPLHSRGYVGFAYSRDMSQNIVGQGFEQEISSDFDGAVFHPDFISFSSSFSYGHASVSTNTGLSAGNHIFAGSENFMVLPASAYPLVINYQRTRVGLGQQGLSSTTNTDRLNFDWRLNPEKLPKMTLRWGKSSNWSDVPVSAFAASGSRNSGASVSATDTFKGWEWNAGWLRNRSETDVLLLDQPATSEQGYTILSGNASRQYRADRGYFVYSASRTTNQSEQGLLSKLNGVQTAQSASNTFWLTSKLMSTGSFQHYAYSSRGRLANPAAAGRFTYFAPYPGSGYGASGSLTYQLHPRLSLSDAISYSTTKTAPNSPEQATSYFTNSPSVNANYRWRRLHLSGSYGLGYIDTGTNLDRSFGSWENNVGGSASWSHPWISLSGGAGVGHATIGVLPGSYSDSSSYSFAAESSKLRSIGELRFRWQLLDRTALGNTGFLQSRRGTWSLALTRKRWQVEGGASSGSGATQAFAEPALVFQALPELAGELLYQADTHSYFVSGSGRLRPNLQINGRFRRDVQQIPAAGQVSYSLYEFYVNYRIGKITLDGSYGHYANRADTLTSKFASSSDRFRIRIVRTFTLL